MASERNLLKLIKNQELLDASKKAFETAEMHIMSAEAIAKQKHYGIPVSHLILSTEQTVAGIIIYAEHLGFGLKNIPGMYLFFTDHIIKHNFANIFITLYQQLKYTMSIVEKFRDKDSGRLNLKDFDEKSLINKKEIITLFKNLPEMFEWWDNANLQKKQRILH